MEVLRRKDIDDFVYEYFIKVFDIIMETKVDFISLGHSFGENEYKTVYSQYKAELSQYIQDHQLWNYYFNYSQHNQEDFLENMVDWRKHLEEIEKISRKYYDKVREGYFKELDTEKEKNQQLNIELHTLQEGLHRAKVQETTLETKYQEIKKEVNHISLENKNLLAEIEELKEIRNSLQQEIQETQEYVPKQKPLEGRTESLPIGAGELYREILELTKNIGGLNNPDSIEVIEDFEKKVKAAILHQQYNEEFINSFRKVVTAIFVYENYIGLFKKYQDDFYGQDLPKLYHLFNEIIQRLLKFLKEQRINYSINKQQNPQQWQLDLDIEEDQEDNYRRVLKDRSIILNIPNL